MTKKWKGRWLRFRRIYDQPHMGTVMFDGGGAGSYHSLPMACLRPLPPAIGNIGKQIMTDETTLAAWITELADGEPVQAIVLGKMGWGDFGSKDVPNYDAQRKGVVLTWEEAKPMISYEFNDGFGSPGCNCVVAWTASWIISVSSYDGSTSPFRIPRNPTAHMPEMPGGN